MSLIDSILRRLYLRAFGGVRYARRLGVSVGEDCRVITTNFGTEPFLIEMGHRVTVAAGVVFLTHDGATWLLRDDSGRRQEYRRIVIGSNVFIGHSVILLPGVKIGDNVIIGAGTVVTRSIPSDSVVAGNPARFLCSYQEYASRQFRLSSEATGNTHRERVISIINSEMRPELNRFRRNPA